MVCHVKNFAQVVAVSGVPGVAYAGTHRRDFAGYQYQGLRHRVHQLLQQRAIHMDVGLGVGFERVLGQENEVVRAARAVGWRLWWSGKSKKLL